ncbi:MAG: hypothetical protein ACP5PV_12695 [Methanothrix sp.]
MNGRRGLSITHIGILDIFVVIIGSLIWLFADLIKAELSYINPGFQKLPISSMAFLVTLFILACITFFGILAKAQTSTGIMSHNRGDTRIAITASILVVYFFMLGVNTFCNPPKEMTQITRTLMDSFTYVVGTVMIFYFGASAYVQVHARDKDDTATAIKERKEGE